MSHPASDRLSADPLDTEGPPLGAGARPLCLGGAALDRHRHICAFFSSREDEYRVLLPFIKDGLDANERAVHIVDPRRRDEHLGYLRAAGIDADLAEREDRLDLRTWAEAHLLDGVFNQERTRRLIAEIRQDGQRDGFARTRFVTHMEWALEAGAGIDALLEYEARANLAVPGDPVVCVYDLARFGGDVIVDVMRTHPLIIIGGILHENPFFVPPDQFLGELLDRARRRQATTVPA